MRIPDHFPAFEWTARERRLIYDANVPSFEPEKLPEQETNDAQNIVDGTGIEDKARDNTLFIKDKLDRVTEAMQKTDLDDKADERLQKLLEESLDELRAKSAAPSDDDHEYSQGPRARGKGGEGSETAGRGRGDIVETKIVEPRTTDVDPTPKRDPLQTPDQKNTPVEAPISAERLAETAESRLQTGAARLFIDGFEPGTTSDGEDILALVTLDKTGAQQTTLAKFDDRTHQWLVQLPSSNEWKLATSLDVEKFPGKPETLSALKQFNTVPKPDVLKVQEYKEKANEAKFQAGVDVLSSVNAIPRRLPDGSLIFAYIPAEEVMQGSAGDAMLYRFDPELSNWQCKPERWISPTYIGMKPSWVNVESATLPNEQFVPRPDGRTYDKIAKTTGTLDLRSLNARLGGLRQLPKDSYDEYHNNPKAAEEIRAAAEKDHPLQLQLAGGKAVIEAAGGEAVVPGSTLYIMGVEEGKPLLVRFDSTTTPPRWVAALLTGSESRFLNKRDTRKELLRVGQDPSRFIPASEIAAYLNTPGLLQTLRALDQRYNAGVSDPKLLEKDLAQRARTRGVVDFLQNRGAVIDTTLTDGNARSNYISQLAPESTDDIIQTALFGKKPAPKYEALKDKAPKEPRIFSIQRGKETAFFRFQENAKGKRELVWSSTRNGSPPKVPPKQGQAYGPEDFTWTSLTENPWPDGEMNDDRKALIAIAKDAQNLQAEPDDTVAVLQAKEEENIKDTIDQALDENEKAQVALHEALLMRDGSFQANALEHIHYQLPGKPRGALGFSTLAVLNGSGAATPQHMQLGIYRSTEDGTLRNAQTNAVLWPRTPNDPDFETLVMLRPMRAIHVLRNLDATGNPRLANLQGSLSDFQVSQPAEPVPQDVQKVIDQRAFDTARVGKAYILGIRDLGRLVNVHKAYRQQAKTNSEAGGWVGTELLNTDLPYETSIRSADYRGNYSKAMLAAFAQEFPEDGTADQKLELLQIALRRVQPTEGPNLQEVNAALGTLEGRLKAIKAVNDTVAGFFPGGKQVAQLGEWTGRAVGTGELPSGEELKRFAKDTVIDYTVGKVTGKINIPKAFKLDENSKKILVRGAKVQINKYVEKQAKDFIKKPLQENADQLADDLLGLEHKEKEKKPGIVDLTKDGINTLIDTYGSDDAFKIP